MGNGNGLEDFVFWAPCGVGIGNGLEECVLGVFPGLCGVGEGNGLVLECCGAGVADAGATGAGAGVAGAGGIV